MRSLKWLLLIFLLLGCNVQKAEQTKLNQGGEQSKLKSKETPLSKELEADDRATKAEISVLFLGNSHSAPIPALLTEIFRRQKPEITTSIRTAPSFGFLADQVHSKLTTDMLRSGDWDFVVLQAQKYSTSGKYTYPTDAAIELSTMAQDAGSNVIMYPEWSRKGMPDEYQRIRAIHDSIAKQTDAVVAPIGESWALAISELEISGLYQNDGNHASPTGSYLNACIFYSMIANESAEAIGAAESKDKILRRKLERLSWHVVQEKVLRKSK